MNASLNGNLERGIAENPQLNMYVAVFGASAIAIIIFGILKGYTIGKVSLICNCHFF